MFSLSRSKVIHCFRFYLYVGQLTKRTTWKKFAKNKLNLLSFFIILLTVKLKQKLVLDCNSIWWASLQLGKSLLKLSSNQTNLFIIFSLSWKNTGFRLYLLDKRTTLKKVEKNKFDSNNCQTWKLISLMAIKFDSNFCVQNYKMSFFYWSKFVIFFFLFSFFRHSKILSSSKSWAKALLARWVNLRFFLIDNLKKVS